MSTSLKLEFNHNNQVMFDLLKIRYFFVLKDGGDDKTSPFQGFSHDLPDLHWAMHLVAELPSDVLEPAQPLDAILAQRIGGERQLVWVPIDVSALEQARATEFGAFNVCFSGDEAAAERVEAWIVRQDIPVFHLRLTSNEDAERLNAFTILDLRDYCRQAFEAQTPRFSDAQRQAITSALGEWSVPEWTPTDHPPLGHNIFLPNQMVLRRALKDAKAEKWWMGTSEEQYTEGIVASVRSVMAVREEIGCWNFHRMLLPTPALILAEPALYRHSYKSARPEGPFKDPIVKQTLRLLQTQKTLCNETDAAYVLGLEESPAARSLFTERGRELTTFTLAAGLRAASTSAAVMRLSPGVNHVFSKLDNYARHIRSNRLEARRKSRRLFENIQRSMADALGPKRMDMLREEQGPVKLVSDCPLEWLNIDGLPLSLARDCSRINATPGNVMITQLAQTQAVNVLPSAFERPLVVSSFDENDPLRNIMRGSLQAMRAGDGSAIDHEFRRVNTVDEFVDALNAYQGSVMIFDGHGAANTDDPVGGIIIGGEKVDVWQLRSRVRIPPIVILSACDTQSADARSHATVGNGFLALGAKTVVATLLPVGGQAAALFAARFLLRLKDYLPAALRSGWRVLNWTEVVSGMLRMTLISEVLDEIVGTPLTKARNQQEVHDLQVRANLWINSREIDWYDQILSDLAELVGRDEAAIRHRAAGVIARSEAVRYIQLGNPEMIRITDHNMERALGTLAEHPI